MKVANVSQHEAPPHVKYKKRGNNSSHVHSGYIKKHDIFRVHKLSIHGVVSIKRL